MSVAPTVQDRTEFLRGITFKPDELIDLDDPDAVVCIRTKNIQRDLDANDLIAVPRRLVRNKDKFLREGDVLISTANSWDLVGKCTYVPKLQYEATAGGFISVVRAKKGTHPRFLYHWLNAPRTQFTLRHLGRQTTNISNLDVNRFKALAFPDFEYEEQRRIAAILDKADAIRRKREQALALADDLLKSAFLEMFGDPISNPRAWPIQALGSLLQDIRYGTSAKCSAAPSESSVPVLRIPNVIGEAISWASLKHAELSVSDWSRLQMRDGDILFVRTNGNPEYIGRCAAFQGDREAAFASYLIRARLKTGANVAPQFIAKAISMPSFRHRLIRDAKTTAGNFNINTKALKALPIICPPMELQARYQKIANQVAAWSARSAEALAEAEQLFTSLSQRAFRGEL